MSGFTWWTAARVAALKTLLEDGGASYREAAAVLSHRYRRTITPRAVNRLACRAGLHSRRKGGRPKTRNAPATPRQATRGLPHPLPPRHGRRQPSPQPPKRQGLTKQTGPVAQR